ncbi:hypothetical protein JHK85_004256 [Glycine max]|nr:hypothetical protein JHK85_004256 [Glycine max]KAG5080020.1 hypothetical protein JHK86_004085 [Glycine max]
MQEIFLGLLFLSRTCIRRHQFFNFRCRNDVVWCFFVFHNDNAVWGNNVLSVRAVGGVMLKDTRGYTLKWSHYLPSPFPEDTSLPCVIYCHGNKYLLLKCRADANEAAVILLPSNITVFTLDFSGSGLFDGDYVSLGWHEKDDLKMEVSYLRSNKQISRIGLWG